MLNKHSGWEYGKVQGDKSFRPYLPELTLPKSQGWLRGRSIDQRLWEFQEGSRAFQLEGREQAFDPGGISVPQSASSMGI